MHFEVQNFCFFCPCAGLVHFEVQNLDIFCPGAGFRQGVGLQSRPNLHRDKKNTSFELQRTPNLHRDKKNKKNKNFTIYLGRGDYPSKVFVFFVFFVPVQVWRTLKFKTFVFFVPVQVWCTLKFKTWIFFVPVQVLDRVLDFKVDQTCTGTKKNTSFELQTCTGTKKTKVLNFKVHQTCTGTKKTKKTKTSQSTWEGATIPLKFLFFLFFLSLCRFGAL